jgi:hypothetical protein
MNERTVVKCVVAALASVVILASGNTDLIYILAGALFFALCMAYAAWCERL